MNLLLLFPEDFIASNQVYLTDHRLQHLLMVKNIQLHDVLEVGLLNGKVGTGRVVLMTANGVEVQVQLDREPVAPLPVNVILALPRPKMLKRILQTISAMGVKKLILIHSAKVEKSYWQSPWLELEKLAQNLYLGLEQAKDTMLPQVQCYRRFKPFVEDVLPGLIAGSKTLLAHPGRGDFCPANTGQPVTLIIGPEGGFVDYEVDKFIQAGAIPCHLGERILRVENAVAVLLGRLS